MNISRISRISVIFVALFVLAPSVQATEPKCSSDYDGQYVSHKPEVSSDLCAVGSPSGKIEGDGSKSNPWKWHCYDEQGNEGDRCEAFKELCGNGKIDSGEQCDGGPDCNNSCEMEAKCGSADGGEFEEKPSSNLCSVGSPSGTLEGDGSVSNPWKWHCYDSAGNADNKCTATKKVEEVVVEEKEEIAEEVEEEEIVVQEKTAPAASCAPSDYSDIKGHIWHDDNRNGVIDAGETGIEDVTVELYDSNGNEVEEDETNADGKFRFENYAPGKYTIDVHGHDRELDGFTIVYENDANFNERDQIKLKCNNNHTKTLFGYDTGASVEGVGGNSNRPTTLAQTGGSMWSYIIGFFIK